MLSSCRNGAYRPENGPQPGCPSWRLARAPMLILAFGRVFVLSLGRTSAGYSQEKSARRPCAFVVIETFGPNESAGNNQRANKCAVWHSPGLLHTNTQFPHQQQPPLCAHSTHWRRLRGGTAAAAAAAGKTCWRACSCYAGCVSLPLRPPFLTLLLWRPASRRPASLISSSSSSSPLFGPSPVQQTRRPLIVVRLGLSRERALVPHPKAHPGDMNNITARSHTSSSALDSSWPPAGALIDLSTRRARARD